MNLPSSSSSALNCMSPHCGARSSLRRTPVLRAIRKSAYRSNDSPRAASSKRLCFGIDSGEGRNFSPWSRPHRRILTAGLRSMSSSSSAASKIPDKKHMTRRTELREKCSSRSPVAKSLTCFRDIRSRTKPPNSAARIPSQFTRYQKQRSRQSSDINAHCSRCRILTSAKRATFRFGVVSPARCHLERSNSVSR